MLALALPSISKELQLSSVSAGALSTYTLLGMGIGGVLAGWLSDRIGRVRVDVVVRLHVHRRAPALIALCQTYWQIAVMRFVSGFGIARALQHRHAARRRSTCRRASAPPCLACCRPAGRSAMSSRRCSPRTSLPRFGWRPLFCLRDPAGHRRAGAAGRPAGSAQLVRAAAAAARSRAAGSAFARDVGEPAAAANVPAVDASRRSRCSSATTARTPGCRAIW